MKKSLKSIKAALVMSVIAMPAMAVNMENPLYMPESGKIYSKTSAGVMIKKVDQTDANVLNGSAGATKFPIYRITEDIGYGITDRLMVHGVVGYTQDDDSARKGSHLGRVGATYRMLGDASSAVWDIYGDIHLGGMSKMEGAYTTKGFEYDNYSNGRWGAHVGTKMGNTWGNITGMMFAEVLQTFGNHNNEIDVTEMITPLGSMATLMKSDTVAVNLKSTTEFNAGMKTFYEFDNNWSLGGGLTYKHHENNGVKSLYTKIPAGSHPALGAVIIPALEKQLKNMEDGFDEYIVSVSVANQLTEYTQIAMYADYTMDTAQRLSQNGTDKKIEAGVRLNVQF